MVVVKTGILVLGGLITYFTAKAHRRTGDPSLRALAVGFGVIDTLVDASLAGGVLVDATLTFVGFAVITYSLYVE